MITEHDYSAVRNAYVACALWASLDEPTGEPLDAHYGPADLAEVTQDDMMTEVIDFVIGCQAERPNIFDGINPELVGHDFWLTRNRHGAGFWDRGLGERGDWLTEASRPYGSAYLYVGDDGKIYQHD